VGGGERWIDNVILALDKGAPELQQAMVAIGSKSSIELRGGGAMLRILPNERRSGGPMDGISAGLWREFQSFDLIHVHQSLTDFGTYACCVAASLGKTVVLTDLGGGSNAIMLRGGLKMADGIVSISKYAHNMIASSVGTTPNLIAIGPIDTDKFRPADFRSDARAAICVSRVMPHKGIDRLIRALPPGLKLRVVGKVYHEEYRRLLGSLASGKDVEFIHDASDDHLLDLYRQSSVFLQASCIQDVYGSIAPKTELMGLTTLEAMSCGLPVMVSADGGSLPELVTDERFGHVFANEDDLTSMLLHHMAGRWPAPGARQLAREHTIAEHGLSSFGHKLADFYLQVHYSRVQKLACESLS
jgi:glycosyltransferase involved in cell wall biosynthesis